VTRYLLDTNVVSELRKPKPPGAVVAWMKTLRPEQIFLSAVTIGELQAGVELTRKSDAGKALEIETWLTVVEASFTALPMDSACFREWARLMTGKSPNLIEDAMIAATARVLACTWPRGMSETSGGFRWGRSIRFGSGSNLAGSEGEQSTWARARALSVQPRLGRCTPSTQPKDQALCQRGSPIREGFEPLISRRAENCDEPVTLFG
jgi:predicted nucleic acid-binding protein